jgi:hypothetical protein
MRLQQIQNNYLYEDLDTIVNTSRRSIFESIGQGDTYFTQWEKEIHPVLCEVALTPDQIQQLFTTVEKGSDRTLLGKGLDAAGAAKDKISDVWFNKFGGMLQSSTPVKAFDQKFEEIKSKIAAENPKLAAKLAKYGEFAKDNPNLHKFLLAIAGSVAAALGVAAAGGIGASALAIGTGTAIAVGIVNIADRLLKGEKASTAIGRGATAGAVAGLTAGAIAKVKEFADQFSAVKALTNKVITGDGQTFYLNPEDGKKYADYGQAFADSINRPIDMSSAQAMFANPAGDAAQKGMSAILQAASDPEYQKAAIEVAGKYADPTAIQSAVGAAGGLLSTLNSAVSAVAGQAAGGAGEKPAPKESFTVNGKKLSEGQVYMIFNRVSSQQQLAEGPMDWLKTKAKNLTTKVTADKLNSAWKKAGSPMDSEEVAKILTAAGVGDDIVGKVYTDLKLPAPGSAPAAGSEENPAAAQAAAGGYAEVKKAIAQLNTKDRKRMIAYLTKQLGTA